MRRFLVYFIIALNLNICLAYAAVEQVTIEVSIKDHKFEPNEIRAAHDTKIKLIVHNLDDSVEEFESNDLKREKIVPANGHVTIVLPPLPPGKYHFFGDFHPETAQGDLIIE